MAIAMGAALFSSSFSSGNSGAFCSSCHGNGTSTNGSITLTGVPASPVVGESYPLEVCLVDPSKLIAGFTLTVNAGTLTSDDGTSYVDNGNAATHNGPKPFGSPGNPACWNVTWEAPTTGTSVDFNYRGVGANGANGSGGDNGGYSGQMLNVALPVEWVSVYAEKVRDGVEVYWSTANEINNDRFIVQRSIDGAYFESIYTTYPSDELGRLNEYVYLDKTEQTANTLYYRVMQIDYDGTIDYSDVKTVYNKSLSELSVYPNPASKSFDRITVDGSSGPIYIYDEQGLLVYRQNMDVGSNQVTLPNDMPTGRYYLSDGSDSQALILLD